MTKIWHFFRYKSGTSRRISAPVISNDASCHDQMGISVSSGFVERRRSYPLTKGFRYSLLYLQFTLTMLVFYFLINSNLIYAIRQYTFILMCMSTALFSLTNVFTPFLAQQSYLHNVFQIKNQNPKVKHLDTFCFLSSMPYVQ